MSFPFGNMFGAVVEDERVPENQLRLYSRNPVEVVCPCGHKELGIPDVMLINFRREPSKLDWVPAAH
jgi:hypothetical protein